MIHKDTYSKDIDFPGSKGLVYIGDKILIYRRDTNTEKSPLMIDIPGGGREGNESPFDTFKRELFEEFSLHIYPDNIVYAINTDPGNRSFFFVAKLPASEEKNIIFGNEGVEFFLLELNEYLKKDDVIDRHKDWVLEYLASIQI